jgi:hypothetical protein
MSRTNESKYGKKTSFSREKQYARSEAEIEHVSNNLDEWKQVRKEEREKNLRIASGKPAINEQATDKPATDKPVTGKPAINEHATDKRSTNKERSAKEYVNEPTTYYAKMNFVLHEIPLSYNIDNVLRSFQYFGKVQYVRSRMNAETSTYTVTIVADEWNETIKDIQADIFNKGFAIMDKYKVTADETQSVNEYGEKIETNNYE